VLREQFQNRLRSLLTMELFDGLFDDETLLESAQAPPLAQVIADHRRLRAGHIGRIAALVVRDTQLAAVSRQLPADAHLPVSVITTGGAGGLLALRGRQLPGIDVVSIEPTLRDLSDLAGSAARVAAAAAELTSDHETFVALPHFPGWEAAAELLEAAGLHGKIDAVEPGQTIEQMSILIEMDLPFKITGRSERDWLRMINAVDALIEGAGQQDVALLIEDGNHDQTAATVASWDQATQSRVRRRLRRVGTDSVQQAVNALELAPPSSSNREAAGTG
jgi:hypothetical protein